MLRSNATGNNYTTTLTSAIDNPNGLFLDASGQKLYVLSGVDGFLYACDLTSSVNGRLKLDLTVIRLKDVP